MIASFANDFHFGDSSYDDARCELKALTGRPGWNNGLYALCGHAVVQYTPGKSQIEVVAGAIGEKGGMRLSAASLGG